MATQTVSHNDQNTSRLEPWPDQRPTEQVIAERMLAAALHNYHAVMTQRGAGMAAMKTWYDLTDVQRAFLLDYAIPQAVQTIWKGR